MAALLSYRPTDPQPLSTDVVDAIAVDSMAVDGDNDPSLAQPVSHGPASIHEVMHSLIFPDGVQNGDPELNIRRINYVKTKELEKNYSCALCKRITYAPRQTHCLRRVCSPCIKPYFSKEHSIENCPLADEAHDDLDDSEKYLHPNGYFLEEDFSRDHVARTTLSKQKCYCYNKEAGCGLTMPQKKLAAHIKVCEYEMVNCQYSPCEFKCRHMDREKHTVICQYAPIACYDCGTEIIRGDQDAHSDRDCRWASQLVCNSDNCGRSFKRRSELLIHKTTNRNCIDKPGPCGYNRYGCPERYDTVEELQDHIIKCADIHLEMLVLHYEAQMKKIAESQDVFNVNHRIRKMETLAGTLFQQVMYQNNTLQNMDQSQGKLEEMTRILNLLIEDTESQKTLQGRLQRRGIESMDKVDKKLGVLKQHLEEVKVLQSGGSTGTVSLPASLTSMAITPSDHLPSTDGELVWTIPGYKAQLERARSGEQASFYSPPFYTSQHGYKMRARVYLYGDGLHKGKKMSIFFLINKGKYDHTLEWPFSVKTYMHDFVTRDEVIENEIPTPVLCVFPRRITFGIIKPNASGEIGEKPRTFLPDGGVAFHQPKSENNPATGCPDFVDLSLVRDKYISRDDELTLFVGVETTAAKDSWYHKVTNYANRN